VLPDRGHVLIPDDERHGTAPASRRYSLK
jgi:hypothetical protein